MGGTTQQQLSFCSVIILAFNTANAANNISVHTENSEHLLQYGDKLYSECSVLLLHHRNRVLPFWGAELLLFRIKILEICKGILQSCTHFVKSIFSLNWKFSILKLAD
jgi:hypothetical protein